MALRSMGNLRSVMSRLTGGSSAYATSTTPKGKAYTPAADYAKLPKPSQAGDFVPVYVAIGMIALSVSLGIHTAMQQLRHSPGVRVKKKTRETLPEVYDPDKVVNESERFLNNSFFRKVAHVQEFDDSEHAVPDPIRGDAYAHKAHVETLKSVGVDPNQF